MEHEARLNAALADRYHIEREIGSGGMAAVYLAEDLKHHRQVAVKVLDPDLAQSLGAERFLREIETAAGLTHPHILPVHDSGEADGFLFYVMPYVKGESLRNRLIKEKQLPVEDAIRITREVADALAYAHEEGIIHRDVKPANIMLEAGHAVLADFGVAHAVAEAKDERITRTGTSLGTPAYMSPEQAAGERDLDGRSDQYALGCVLYEMLAGQPPFTGAQVEAVVRQHLTEPPPSVTQARPSVPREVVGVIHRSLAKSPADRFKTTGEMAAALALTTVPAGPDTKKNTRSLRIALGAAVLVVIGLVATMVLGPAREATPDSGITAEDGRPGIAVLPFDNLSPDPEDAYFADGMQEEITSRLSEVSAVRVTSRTSVTQYEGEKPPSPQIAEELGVEFLVEGSARLAGDRARLTVQLIDARRDTHLWTDDYEADLSAENLFEIESEIARQVAFAVGVTLTPEEREQVGRILTDNTPAFLQYLRGNEAFLYERANGRMGNTFPSIPFYEQAIGHDSAFALAHAKLALSLTYTNPAQDRNERARLGAEQALSLLPDLPEARVALGRYFSRVGRAGDALDQFQAAELENPNMALAALELGNLRLLVGELDAGLQTLQRARRLDPRNPVLLRDLMRSLMFAHRYDEALEVAAAREAAYPVPSALRDRAYLHLLRGEPEAARAAIAEMVALDPASIYRASPGLHWDLVSTVASEEQRRSTAESYFTWEEPCGLVPYVFGCLRIAIHEEEVGSRERARSLFETLRTYYENTTPPVYFYEVLTFLYLGEKDTAIQKAEALVSHYMDEEEGRQPDRFLFGPSARILLARVLAHFGEEDRVIDLLEEILPAPSWLSVPVLEIDPTWDRLRDHPRFQALLEKYADDVEH